MPSNGLILPGQLQTYCLALLQKLTLNDYSVVAEMSTVSDVIR